MVATDAIGMGINMDIEEPKKPDIVVLNGIGNEMTDFTSPLSLINYELVPTPGANATLPYGDTVVQVTYTLEDDS